jgi:GNAT superfamily N-acetyltransferase
MNIEEVFKNKKDFLELLLLADEQEDMIDRYLEAGHLFKLDDDGVKCIAVVLALNSLECELKNIATTPLWQRKGYGKTMIKFLSETHFKSFKTMYVGTGDVPFILEFYKGCGFIESHRVRNFFIDNYKKPIFEGGVQLRDMVYLKKINF